MWPDPEPSGQRTLERLDEAPQGAPAAVALFSQLLRQDVASAPLWNDLGYAFTYAGDGVKAEYCYLRAAWLAPSSSRVLLEVARFYFNTRQYRKGLPYFGRVLSLLDTYDSTVYGFYDLAPLEFTEVLGSGIPDRRAAQAYLRRILSDHDVKKADAMWGWMASRSFGDRSTAAQYAQFLFDQRLVQPAAEVWAEYAKDCSPAYRKATQVYDGGFECEPAKSPFDWRIGELQGVESLLDRSVSQAGRASLRIRFDGAHNTDFHHVSQSVFLGPGRYVLEAWVRSVNVTTDQGVGLRLVDPQSPARLDVETGKITGSHEWMKLQRVFTIAAPALLELQIVRRPSLRFDNQIGGSVWFDSIVIRPMRMGEDAPSPAP